MQDHWIAVDRYIEDLLVQQDPILRSVLEVSTSAGLPPISVSPAQGKLLFLLAKAIEARNILEIGTLGGYSAVWLARALPADGCVVTLEVNPDFAAVARGNFAEAGVSDSVDLRVGQALDVLPQLAAQGAGPFDFVFIDADKASYPDYLLWAIKLARPGGLIVADNVVRDGVVLDAYSDDPAVHGIRRFNAAIAAESRVTATEIQTVGVKGYDGFAVILVTKES